MYLWAHCLPFLDGMKVTLRAASPRIGRLESAGAFRRLCDAVDCCDLLLETACPEQVVADLRKEFGADAVWSETSNCLLVFHYISLPNGMIRELPFRLHLTPPEEWGAALLRETGPKEHWTQLLDRATLQDRDPTRAPCSEEADFYAALDLPWIPPELRDWSDIIDFAARNPLPDLIERDDLRGDLHTHSTWSDGRNTMEEMCEAARQHGLDYIAFTDHTARVFAAGGMPEDEILRQWEEIDRLNERWNDLTVLKGVECDILENGGLDLSDAVLARADWVVASIHFELEQPVERITRRLLEAIEHPDVCVIGHPTGRLIGYHDGCDFDVETLFAAAAATGTFFELNSNPRRLDLNERLCRRAREQGIPIVISSDSHSRDMLDLTRFGINQARRGLLEKNDVINTKPWEEVRARSKKG